MVARDWARPPHDREPFTPPDACPFCRSERLRTGKKPDPAGYWRCETCGEIWSPARLKGRNGSQSFGRF